jgi:hypothetical protein
VEHCVDCHGPEKQKASLRVDAKEFLLRGGDSGAAIIPGNPEKSLLMQSIRHEGDIKMPEKKPKLPEAEIALLSDWIAAGAPWPSNGPVLTQQEELIRSHWAYQPVPPPQDGDLSAQIDRLIDLQLQERGLRRNPQAPRDILIHRASALLTGLPPTVGEVREFLADPRPLRAAMGALIDRLLATPQYGEKWARHWLDVARYADTRGYVFQEERSYAYSYTYRDWVTAALNDDMPYDRFLTLQIAADLVDNGKGNPRDLAALGFLTLGRRFLNNTPDIIDDRIDTVTRSTMGLTVACARCHDHKFDPVTTRDYYALYGVFDSTGEERDPAKLPLLPDSDGDSAEYARKRSEAETRLQTWDTEQAGTIARTLQPLLGIELPLPHQIVAELYRRKTLLTRKARDERKKIVNQLAAVENRPDAPPRAMAVFDKPNPVEPRVLIRGNPNRPGEPVPRRFIGFLGGDKAGPFKHGSGRLELAKAIADPQNPLTARVMANRVWLHHFGTGLVTTPGDFGAKGMPPTNPALLDAIAARWVADGWSLKKLHKAIMLSETWLQTSDQRADAMTVDPENRMYWRQNRRRLDWEQLRDRLLATAGTLDRTVGGKSVDIANETAAPRRTLYSLIDRQNLPGVFRTFDFANPDASAPARHYTTTPMQALFMMNSPFVQRQTREIVSTLDDETLPSGMADERFVEGLFERIFTRTPSSAEKAGALAFLADATRHPNEAPEAPAWSYGYGGWDSGRARGDFKPLPIFGDGQWRPGQKVPDPQFDYLLLTANGGHPGPRPEHAAIRRFTAPASGAVEFGWLVRRPHPQGNGIIARVIHNQQTLLLEQIVPPGGEAKIELLNLTLEKGDTLDFQADSRHGNAAFDSFDWRITVRSGERQWPSDSGFSGPVEPPPLPLNRREQLVQVLLMSNEFCFLD